VRYLATIFALAVIFVLALASVDPWDLVIGAGLAIGVLLLFRSIAPAGADGATREKMPSPLTRILWFFPMCARAAWDITCGTWLVFLFVSGIRKLEHPGIVLVPIGERTPTGVAVSALISTLSPGTVMMEIDFAQGVMLIHAIDASDPDQIRADHQEFYDRYQRHVFP
jgi:multisubunit Na+/H+ antiporter MnhE subunit